MIVEWLEIYQIQLGFCHNFHNCYPFSEFVLLTAYFAELLRFCVLFYDYYYFKWIYSSKTSLDKPKWVFVGSRT